MSNFTVNRNGLDQVTLEFTTTGRSECSVNLKEALLDEKKEYVFSVDHLNVPLDEVPITNNKDDVELFRVLRRNVGTSLNETANFQMEGALFVYTLSQRFYDVASFVRSINNWAVGVERAMTNGGFVDFREFGGPHDAGSAEASVIPPLRVLQPRDDDGITQFGTYDMIRWRLGVDGTLVLVISSDFANNFLLQFSRYGAEILGFSNKMSAVRHQVLTGDVLAEETTDYYLAISEALQVTYFDTTHLLGGAAENIVLAGGNTQTTTIYSEHSLYMTLDQRVKVEISSHLPMLNNLHVKEGKESVDRAISETFFDNRVKSTVVFDREGALKESKISNVLYSGQFPFIKKSDRSKEWHKLLTSFSLRFFRFSIWITYRTYSAEKDEWVFSTTPLPIDTTQYWDFSLRFLSLV